jgi:hypothetical protein
VGINEGRAGVGDVDNGLRALKLGGDERLDGFEVEGREAVRRMVVKLERPANPLACAWLANVVIFG